MFIIDYVIGLGAKTDEENKEFITIVKTTKLTTKVKQIKPNSQQEATTTVGKGSGKKNKKKGKKGQKQATGATSAETSEAATTNNTAVSTNGTGAGSDEDRTSNISSSKDEDDMDKSIEPAADAVATEAAEPDEVIKVDINKSTDEYVFQPVGQIQHQDLNSTALDSEEMLSDYSMIQQTTTTVQINGGPIIEQSTVIIAHPPPESLNEIVNVSDVLSDVTNSLINQTTSNEPTTSTAVTAKTESTATPTSKSTESNIFF